MDLAEDNTDQKEVRMPQKKYFRQRAHSNPLSVHSLEL